jgi:cob(I)alamin adenosyltransferase
MHFDWLETEVVIKWLKKNKPPKLHLVITGRNAPEKLLEYADLVTEMTKIKHPFDQGRKGQKGIEF